MTSFSAPPDPSGEPIRPATPDPPAAAADDDDDPLPPAADVLAKMEAFAAEAFDSAAAEDEEEDDDEARWEDARELVATWVPFFGGRPIRFPEADIRGALPPPLPLGGLSG